MKGGFRIYIIFIFIIYFSIILLFSYLEMSKDVTLNVEEIIIKGEKFQAIADVYLYDGDSNHNDDTKYKIISNINEPYNNPRIVFCYTHNLDSLLTKLDYFKNKFVLITHNSDHKIEYSNNFDKLLHSDLLVMWYAQNLSIDNKKIKPIPIGIENNMWRNASNFYIDNLNIVNNSKSHKTENIFMNFNMATNYNMRGDCLDKLKDKIQLLPGIGYTENLQRLVKYKFCICPEGNGNDTHRLWECFYLHTIPIVLNTPFIQVLKKHIDLPMVILNDWADFDEKMLDYSKYSFDKHYYNLLNFNYYKNQIIQSAEGL